MPGTTQSAGASFQTTSSNSKLASVEVYKLPDGRKRFVPVGIKCCSTYVSISSTCPSSCIYKDNGCYVQAGQTGWIMRRLDDQARGDQGYTVIKREADLIAKSFPRGVPQDGAKGGRDLRLHVGGDVSCRRGAERLAVAVDAWHDNGGGDVWTYTHRWRKISRHFWGSISIFASVETTAAAFEAIEAGYSPAITVDSFPTHKAYLREGLKVVPCPAQTKKKTCVECRLCLEGNLPKGVAIGFALHGPHQNKAREARFRLNILPLPGFEET